MGYMRNQSLRIALLASGSGSNLEVILRGCKDETISATPVAVISNNPKAYALERARRFELPAIVVDHREYTSRQAHEAKMLEALEPYEPELLVLAGYMRIVTPHLIDAFNERHAPGLPGVMNIHPADTTQYQGAHGYEFALGLLPDHPERLEETKITVHFVDAGVDTGPIIAQRAVPVRPDDTLESLRDRGLAIEHQLYPECVDLYAQNKLVLIDGEVRRSP